MVRPHPQSCLMSIFPFPFMHRFGGVAHGCFLFRIGTNTCTRGSKMT